MKTTLLCSFFAFSLLALDAKPRVWIYSDISDKTLPGNNKEGTINDPDDISAMAGYLLMANEFDTLGIVVASTHRKEHATTPNQADWAKKTFGPAYRKDRLGLEKAFPGYPSEIRFMESSIKETAEKFHPRKDYSDLSAYPSVAALVDEAKKSEFPIHVLCWGSLTEPAILVQHLIKTEQVRDLKKFIFIAHWTNSSLHQGTPEHPENVANCREDATACTFMKELALENTISYYECGAIGQAGIVSGAPKGQDYYDQFRSSALGVLFVEGKFAFNCVDHSDSATYWVLLGNSGVSLKDLSPDGTNPPIVEEENTKSFKIHSQQIHDLLLARSKAAAL